MEERLPLQPCPKCGGNPGVTAHMDWDTYRLNWCIGCADCCTHGSIHPLGNPAEDRANLRLAADEWNAMCAKSKGESR